MITYENVTTIAPQEIVPGLVEEPNGRGTFSILWACLAVLLLNTWTVLHLNIPPPGQRWLRRCFHKCKWFIICAIVPDGMVVNAYAQWRAAKKSVRDMRRFYSWWTISHGYYAEMGGYRILDESEGIYYNFRADDLAWLVEQNVIALIKIPVKELRDRSKTDAFAKMLACGQSTWFLITILARVNQDLPITTLELATVAFIGCTWATYFFWWQKPMEVDTFTTIPVPQMSIEQLCNLASSTCFSGGQTHWYRPPPPELIHGWDWFWWQKPMKMTRMKTVNVGHRVPKELYELVKDNFTAHIRTADWYRPAVNECHADEWEGLHHFLVWAIGLIFNGLHLAAWGFHFPTKAESILWKVTALGMLVVTSAWVPCAYALRRASDTSRKKSLVYWAITLFYFLSRVILMVEVFMGLRAQPAAIYYSVRWSSYIPHI